MSDFGQIIRTLHGTAHQNQRLRLLQNFWLSQQYIKLKWAGSSTVSIPSRGSVKDLIWVTRYRAKCLFGSAQFTWNWEDMSQQYVHVWGEVIRTALQPSLRLYANYMALSCGSWPSKRGSFLQNWRGRAPGRKKGFIISLANFLAAGAREVTDSD